MKVKVQYATMIVKNLEESVAFYRDALGFEEGYHVELGPAGRITIMNTEGASVELIESERYPVGLYSVGTDVDDLDEVIAHLASQGIEVSGEPVRTSVGRMVFVKDPNGVNVCLIEHDKAV